MLDLPVAKVAQGWEGVRWYVSPAEVAAIVPNAAIAPARLENAFPLRARLRGSRKMMGHSFVADYLFDARNRFSAVGHARGSRWPGSARHGALLSRV